MKNILKSFFVLSVVGVLAFAATRAFFDDVETSEGNFLQAGAIDLLVDNTSYYNGFPGSEGEMKKSDKTTWDLQDLSGETLFFAFEDLKPGDLGEDTISLHVNNNPAWVCVDLELTANDDYSSTEPELDEPNEVAEISENLFDGELAQSLEFIFWSDDGDNVLEVGEQVLTRGTASDVLDGARWAIADSSTGTGALQPDETRYIGKAWCFGELSEDRVEQDKDNISGPDQRGPGVACDGSSETNIAQTDRMEGNVVFTAVQSRHNEEFLCNPTRIVVNKGPVEMYKGFGARFKSFANTGSNEMYLGIGDLGVGANRVERSYVWSSPETYPVMFTYDPANDKLVQDVDGTTQEYAGFAAKFLGLADTCDEISEVNVMQIAVAARHLDTTVSLKNVTLNGYPLGDFLAVYNQFNNWNVTGFDFNQPFTVAGDLELSGTFSGGDELSKVELLTGCAI